MPEHPSSTDNNRRPVIVSGDSIQTRYARLRHRYGATIIIFIILVLGVCLIALGVRSNLVRDLGIALAPVGLIALIYDLFLKRLFIAEMKQELAQCLRNEFSSIEKFTAGGLIDVFETFPQEAVYEAFAWAKKIQILQTHIPGVVQLRQHLEKIPDDCHIELLILHPQSDFAKIRSVEMGYFENISVIGSKVTADMADIERFCREQELKDRIRIRLYDATPVVSIYSYDDSQGNVIIYCGMFWHGRAALEGPQFKVNGKSFLGAAIRSHFKNVWDGAEELQYPFRIPELAPAAWKRREVSS